MHFNAGSTVHIDGTLNVNAEGGFYLSANANIDLRAFTVNGNVEFYSGRNTFCHDTFIWFFWFTINVGQTCETADYPTTLKASATVESAGFSFGVSMQVNGDGSFYATARTPIYADTVVSTGTVDLWAVRGYAQFAYHMSLTLQSNYPQVSVEGSGTASIKYQHWEIVWPPWDSGWSDWKTAATISVSIRTNPFGACAYVDVFGYDVGGCI